MNCFVRTFVACAAVLLHLVDPSVAQDKIRIGVVLTLSGPLAVLGQQVQRGMSRAVTDLNGRMAGREVELLVKDDELKPDVAISKARSLVEREKVDFVVGSLASNIMVAIHRPVIESGAILISPNAGPSTLAGKSCHPNFFATSYQNDQVHEVMGKVAQNRGYKRVYVLVPNYQAGRDAAAGFKRHFRGGVVDESFVPLNSLDFQSELAKIAAAAPDALFTFMPGGMGVNLVKQYKAAGLAERIPFLSTFTVDEATLPAQQDAAVGMFGAMAWAPSVDTPRNKHFVTAYEKEFNEVPGSYAYQAYDAVNLINSAVVATKGDLSDKAKVRDAIRAANFESLRGRFKFNINGFPIQDFYLTKVVKRSDGKFQTEIVEKIFDQYGDNYAQECKSNP